MSDNNKIILNSIWKYVSSDKENFYIITGIDDIKNIRTDEIDEDSYYIILEIVNNTHVLLRPLDLRELPYNYPISRLMEFYKYVG